VIKRERDEPAYRWSVRFHRIACDRLDDFDETPDESYIDTFERLALAAEYRDDDTGQHTRRVGRMAALLAESWVTRQGMWNS
jgi:response regulator RpfG family c-di-GMP phosphodiesterase